MDIEFSIPAIGHNPGSIGWLAEKMDDTELDVRRSNTGCTCLFADFPHKNEDWTFLARPTTSEHDEYCNHLTHKIVRRYDSLNLKVAPLIERRAPQDGHANALFGQLTPAAEEAAEEWLKGVLDGFVAQWREDGDREEPVSVTVS